MSSRRSLSVRAAIGAVALILPMSAVLAETPQEHVRHMAHQVMPFEVAKTVHVFRMTEFGGVQQVLARDPADSEQIALIRQHLAQEGMQFQHGDYGDPARLHGAGMPGLAELQAGADQIEVVYAELPAGAQLTFRTADLRLLTAVHRWFGAQLSEHGADARAE